MDLVTHQTDWIFLLLSLSAVLVLVARVLDVNRFIEILRLPLSNLGKGISKDFNPLQINRLQDVFLAIAATISLSLSAYYLQRNEQGDYLILGFFRLFILINGVVLFKIFIAALAGWLFGRVREISETQNVWLAFLTCISLLLIPILWLVFYGPIPVYINKIILAIAGLVGVLTILTFTTYTVWRMPSNTSYKILYLCSLEIAPLLVMAKWLI